MAIHKEKWRGLKIVRRYTVCRVVTRHPRCIERLPFGSGAAPLGRKARMEKFDPVGVTSVDDEAIAGCRGPSRLIDISHLSRKGSSVGQQRAGAGELVANSVSGSRPLPLRSALRVD